MIGTIKGFNATLGSGIAVVHFDDGSTALIESGFGMRQIVAAFGSLRAAVGQRIEYETDFGLMSAFSPVETTSVECPVHGSRLVDDCPHYFPEVRE
ncbi:MAG TPA: hypothetical protein VEO18_05935 [Thermoplasmata archaeon]|nr:hypothetical protein [Thermoplasmata archaeon]